MHIVNEIDVTSEQHESIESLRNQSFPEDQANRSYFKQLPHMRALEYQDNQLIGYLGLDYRVMRVGDDIHKILGVIDLCVDKNFCGQGVATSMLSEVVALAETKDVDFVILISDLNNFYSARGYKKVENIHSWLRLDEHKNYGVGVERINELYVRPVSNKEWSTGHIDWLGYMY